MALFIIIITNCFDTMGAPMAYSRTVATVPMTMVEMPEFIARSNRLSSSDELSALQIHIGMHPFLKRKVTSLGNRFTYWLRVIEIKGGRRGRENQNQGEH